MGFPESLIEFMDQYPDDEACERAFFKLRWPEGFVCPRCQGTTGYRLRSRRLVECGACRYQVSVTAGTLFHNRKLPLRKYFLAVYLIGSTPKAPSAAELGRQLGISATSAWFLRRKIIKAMAREPGKELLSGLVELDDAFIGGKAEGKRGRGAGKKTAVVIAAQVSDEGGLSRAHMKAVPRLNKPHITAAAQDMVAPGSKVKTDGLRAMRCLSDAGYDHCPVVIGDPKKTAEVLPWVHVLISNFKRWVLGLFHGVTRKHLQAYLDEFCYRLNRRGQRTDLFRRVLTRCLREPPVSWPQLTALPGTP